MASNKQINKQERAFSKISILFFEVFFETALMKVPWAPSEILSILFFEVFFETSILIMQTCLWIRLPFNPLFWGFLWNRNRSCLNDYLQKVLSILFFEVFFETKIPIEEGNIQEVLSILFFEVFFETRLPHQIHQQQTSFQSSFLRFSLKPEEEVREIQKLLKTFNPLFWGFLWNLVSQKEP